MAGSLSVVSTTMLLANVAVVDSGEVGRSAMYSRYNIGPRTSALWYTRIDGEELCAFIFNLRKETSAMQIGFWYKERIQTEKQL
jgi:hypothetical protein